MKKIYLSIAILAMSMTSYGQRINKWTDAAAGNNNWGNNGNWLFPGSLLATDIAQMDKTSTMNVSRTAVKITTESTSDTYSEIIQTGAFTSIINVTDNGSIAFASTAVGIYHNGTTGSTFKINCKLACNNTGSGNWFSIRNLVAGNTLTFGTTSVLTFNKADILLDNTLGGTTNLEGLIDSSVSSTLSLAGAAGNHTILPGASFGTNIATIKFYSGTPTLNINSTDGVAIYTGSLVAQNANIYTLNVNATNAIASSIQVFNDATLNMTINKDLENMKTYALFNNSKLNLNINNSVTKAWFANSSAIALGTGTSMLNITGFKPGVIRFGTTNTGLTAAQLALITADGDATGKGVELDTNGYLIAKNTLNTTDFNSTTATIYPNPAKDVLNINTQETVQKAEVLTILGETVLTVNNAGNTINVSALNKGIYFLKVTSSNGVSTTKFIKE